MAVIELLYDAYDYESKIVSTAAVPLTDTKIMPTDEAPAGAALISIETASVRIRLDGIAPTSTEGHLLEVGDFLLIYGGTNALRKFQAVRATATDATMHITYLR